MSPTFLNFLFHTSYNLKVLALQRFYDEQIIDAHFSGGQFFR